MSASAHNFADVESGNLCEEKSCLPMPSVKELKKVLKKALFKGSDERICLPMPKMPSFKKLKKKVKNAGRKKIRDFVTKRIGEKKPR